MTVSKKHKEIKEIQNRVEEVAKKVLVFDSIQLIEVKEMTISEDTCFVFGVFNCELGRMQQVNYYKKMNYYEFNCHAISEAELSHKKQLDEKLQEFLKDIHRIYALCSGVIHEGLTCRLIEIAEFTQKALKRHSQEFINSYDIFTLVDIKKIAESKKYEDKEKQLDEISSLAWKVYKKHSNKH